jgi:hypothetical protein
MSLISQFLGYWRRRLDRASAPAPVPSASTDWLVRVQARILTFLVSRYGDERAARREESLLGLAPHTLDTSLFDLQPVEVRPRSRERLGAMLHTIHQLNVDAWRARRWRWFV